MVTLTETMIFSPTTIRYYPFLFLSGDRQPLYNWLLDITYRLLPSEMENVSPYIYILHFVVY